MLGSSSMASSSSTYLSVSSLSASSLESICIACDELAIRKDRRVIGRISGESVEVTLLWKEFNLKELEQVNIESVFEAAYMCRKCSYAYPKLLKAKG